MDSKEKEQAQKMKQLRRELEEKMEEQLPAEMLEEKTRVEIQQINEQEILDPAKAKQVIEALLFASNRPLTVNEIRKVVKLLTPSQISSYIEVIKSEYASSNRGFELIEIANGFEIATRKECAPWVLKLELQKKARQVTQSALETLSILAYKQPVTRVEIEELRGVDVSGVINTLIERGFIKIVGRKEVPGRPFMYGTTEKFLEHFGLKALTDLPNIDEIRNLVENSVKKEDLLGTQKMVDVPAEQTIQEGVLPENVEIEKGALEEVLPADDLGIESPDASGTESSVEETSEDESEEEYESESDPEKN